MSTSNNLKIEPPRSHARMKKDDLVALVTRLEREKATLTAKNTELETELTSLTKRLKRATESERNAMELHHSSFRLWQSATEDIRRLTKELKIAHTAPKHCLITADGVEMVQ